MYDFINKKYHDYLVIISPTIYQDVTSSCLLEYADEVHDDYDDSIIYDLVEMQKSDEDNQNILLICDDCVGIPMKALKNISTRQRHHRLSIILSLQSFKDIASNPVLRSNASGYIIGKVKSISEFKKMSEQFGGLFGGEKNFKKIYLKAVSNGKYNFLYLDLKNRKAFQNFTTLLYDDNKDENDDEIIV
jgi:hypothetical protein